MRSCPFSVSYQNFEIAAVHPVRIHYAHGRCLPYSVPHNPGHRHDLQFQGNIPVQSTEPASLLLLGTVDLSSCARSRARQQRST